MEEFGVTKPIMLVLGADPMIVTQLADVAATMEWRIQPLGARFDWPSEAAPATPPALILCDIRSSSETADREIEAAAQYAGNHDIALIAWTDMQRLDDAAFLVGGTSAELLVDPQPAEMAYALTMARGQRRGAARENRGESRELMRLSDELLEMARRIAAFTRESGAGGNGSQGGGGQVRADPLGFRGLPGGAASPLGQEDLPPIKPGQLREMIRLRRMREDLFESDLFADPAWDMLLDLMASRLEERSVSVSSLCIASAVPATTALRWIKLMTDRGLLERRADKADARRIFIALSEDAAVRLQRLLAAMLAKDVPTV